METTQTLRFKTKALAVLSKCYDHAQTHLKGGVLQVNLLSVNYGGPRDASRGRAPRPPLPGAAGRLPLRYRRCCHSP